MKHPAKDKKNTGNQLVPFSFEGEILIIDDSTVDRIFLEAVLKKSGYRTLQAANGPMAISLAKRTQPDLILLDIMMWSMSGYEVCEQLKADERTQDIPVIFISSLDEPLDKVRAFSIGAVDYISKPFQIDEVVCRVRSHMTIRILYRQLADRNARLLSEITERQRTEEALQQAYNELEKRVEQRTASLEEANIRLEAEIVERTQLQGIIEKSKAELMAIYDAAPMIMLLLNEKGRIRKANYLAAEMAGCSFPEAIGLHVGNVVNCPHAAEHPDQCGRSLNCMQCGLQKTIKDTLATGKTHKRVEIKIKAQPKAEAAEIWMQLTTVPLQISGKRHVLVCMQDISEHKKTDELLKKSYNELEKRVEQRTLALENSEKQLKKAKRAAEAANAIKGKFLANMSHEIRTPLNAILGFTYLSLKTDLTPTQLNYLEKIRSSSGSLLEIINEILDFSKIEAGKLEMMNRTFRLRTILDDVRDIFYFQAEQKEIEFSVSAASDAPDILFGDPLRFKQVLMNLTGNAIKFTPKGRVRVEVALEEETESRVLLQCRVEDTGIGIPPAHISNIFSPFSQVDDSETREFQGTGLGLSISSHIVKRMGGKIRVESEPGKGSVFSFMLSFEKRNEAALTDAPPPMVENNDTSLFLEGKTILLVEDNDINRELMLNLIGHEKNRIDIAQSGHEAMTLAARSSYDVILMDLQIPGMNGYEATRMIRENELKAGGKQGGSPENRVPIIGLTAHAIKGIREKCLEAGMDDYISKPVDPVRFLSVIKRWLEIPDPANNDRGLWEDSPAAGGASDIRLLEKTLSGVAVQPILELLKGNVPLLISLLKKLEQFSDIPDTVQNGLKAGELKEALARIHELKGVAGNLSAINLHRFAIELERVLKQQAGGEEPDAETLSSALVHLQEALDQIQQGVTMFEKSSGGSASGAPSPAAPISREEIRRQLMALYNDLKMYKTSSDDRFAALRPHLPRQEAGKEIRRLEMQIDAYDFEGAQETLQQIAGIMNIQLDP